MKNKIILILLILALHLPILAEESVNVDSSTSGFEQVETKTISYKQTTSPINHARKLLAAMGGVVLSSILLFVILSLYNKLRTTITTSQNFSEDSTNSLESPNNLSSAVKAFIDKTNWD